MCWATSRPIGVSWATAARSRSPEEMCSTPRASAIRAPCVPFPPPGGASMSTFTARAYPLVGQPHTGVRQAALPWGLSAADDRQMKYRDRLPQLDSDLFLTDGGLETVLVFHEG